MEKIFKKFFDFEKFSQFFFRKFWKPSRTFSKLRCSPILAEKIGKKIKQARKEREIFIENIDDKIDVKGYYLKKPASQVMVAQALKTTFQQIGKYEKGENRVPLINLVRISKFLNKPLSYFLED